MQKSRIILLLFVCTSVPAICHAQSGRPVSIENLGSWNVGAPILMVNTPYGQGTHFDSCYMNDTYQTAFGNISVYLEYADQWVGPVTHVTQDAWRLEFEDLHDFEVCFPLTYDNVDGRYEFWLWAPFDSASSSTGIYSISRALYAGGHGSCTVKLVYSATNGNEYVFGTMHYVSPDINGDGAVNISDTSAFATMYYSGTYHKEIDFAYSGVIDLSDLGRYASAAGETCP